MIQGVNCEDFYLFCMPQEHWKNTKKYKKEAAARAQQGLLLQQKFQSTSNKLNVNSDFEGILNNPQNTYEECGWDGTVNCYVSSDSDLAWTDSGADDEGTEYSKLEGDKVSLKACRSHWRQNLKA